MSETPLTLEQMKNVVERRGGDIPRVPFFWHKFYNSGTAEKYGYKLRAINDSVVDDCISLNYIAPGNFTSPDDTSPEYKWAIEADPGDLNTKGITSRLVVSSTELIDDVIEAIPNPSVPTYYENAQRIVRDNPDRYCVAWDFFCLFERAWFLFGMENILCEMLINPDRMKRLFRAFTDYHKKVIAGYANAGAHAYFTSDDLGTQETLIFSRKLFRDQYLPLYEEMIDYCHSLGMHFWLHSCGAVTDFLDDFVSIGLDVLHPIQPVAMNQQAVAKKYRNKLTFLAGIDVQYLLPTGTVQDVVNGTKKLIDTFDNEEGGCILAASNGIMPETPLENIEAWLKTAESYGREKRESYS